MRNCRVFLNQVIYRRSITLNCRLCDLEDDCWVPDVCVFYHAMPVSFLPRGNQSNFASNASNINSNRVINIDEFATTHNETISSQVTSNYGQYIGEKSRIVVLENRVIGNDSRTATTRKSTPAANSTITDEAKNIDNLKKEENTENPAVVVEEQNIAEQSVAKEFVVEQFA